MVWVAGQLGKKGIPCRQRRDRAGVTLCVWTRCAVAAAACKKGEDEGANGGDGFRDAASDALVETPTVEDAVGPMVSLWVASEWMGCGSEGGAVGVDKEVESTHHLLRRYRRRLFLILAGPIWDFWLRHRYYCAVVESRRIRAARVRAFSDGRGLGGDAVAWPAQFQAQSRRR